MKIAEYVMCLLRSVKYPLIVIYRKNNTSKLLLASYSIVLVRLHHCAYGTVTWV